jgi:MYXO-CTERM domain-containing protein
MSLLASSLLLVPVTTTFAQTATPPSETRPPETRYVETRTDHDKRGLWGLLGLAGLLGLTGLGRRREDVRSYPDPRERSKV